MTEQVKLNFEKWNIKTEENDRGRMKITVKLNKEEAESLKNWMTAVKPDEVQEDQFFKHIFFEGVNTLNQRLTQMAEREIAKQQLEAQKKAALEGDGVVALPTPTGPFQLLPGGQAVSGN